MLGVNAVDYRSCDFTKPSAFVLGAEKWGLTAEAGGVGGSTGVHPDDRDGAVAECERGGRHLAV